ncbi:MAG: trigger factor [Thermodesulfobacteriota bacterium]
MQVTVEDISPLTKKLTVILPPDQVAREMDKAYRKLKDEVSVQGFRKGKVPRRVLERQFASRVTQEVSAKLVQDTYFDAVEQVQLDPVTHPEITSEAVDADGNLVYEAEVSVRPEFTIARARGLDVEMPEVVVDDTEVDAALEELRKQMAPLKPVTDRGIQIGDVAVIDFAGFDGERPVPQAQAQSYSVDVGSGQNGREFEEGLLGLLPGSAASRVVNFPPHFANPILAGKAIRFEITVREVNERQLPALDDDLAKDVNDSFASLGDLKEHLRNERRQRKLSLQEGDIQDRIMAILLTENAFTVPERLVRYEVNELIKDFESHLGRQGHTLESAGVEKAKLEEQYRDVAERRVRGDFILKRIAEDESIKLTDADVDKGFGRVAAQTRMPLDEVKRYFADRTHLLPFMHELLNEKILAFLRQHAVITRVPAPVAEAAAEATQEGANG